MENSEEKLQKHQQRVNRLNAVWESFQRQQEQKTQQNPRNVMFNALGGEKSSLKAPEKMNLVQKALYASEDEIINDGKDDKKLSSFVEELADAIEKDTFYFDQALSIERINCETSTMNEYFTWIDEGQEIIKHMNDGFVSEDDLKEKTDFVDMSFQRETELITCLGLYEKSMQLGNKEAKVKFDELRLKLQKLREIRSSILITTGNEADKKVEREEYEKALNYYRMLGLLREMDDKPTETQLAVFRMKAQELQVAHDADVEMLPGYSFYTRLLEDVRRSDIAERNAKELNFDHSLSYNRSPGEFLYMAKHAANQKEDIRTRIERLRGLRPPLKDLPTYDATRLRQRALTREGIEAALTRQVLQEQLVHA